MSLKLTASQRRGALVAVLLIGLLAVWRIRVATQRAAAPPPIDSTAAPVAERAAGSLRVELNGADSLSLLEVSGIGPAFAHRIIRFRELIGGYTDPEQLLRVYGITPEKYLRMESQVYVDTTTQAFRNLRAQRKAKQASLGPAYASGSSYPSARSSGASQPTQAPLGTPTPTSDLANNTGNAASTPTSFVLNLNTADSSSLVKVPGIGPGTAGRIVKYRERLQFFRSLDQLSEVWGMRPENLERMKPHLTIGDLSAYPRVYINTWDVSHLGRHPYIGYRDAKIIVAYREEHGPFKDISALRFVHAIDPALPGRLEGYLQF